LKIESSDREAKASGSVGNGASHIVLNNEHDGIEIRKRILQAADIEGADQMLHGDPMTKADFLQWRNAYNNLLACARSAADKKACVAGWDRDAAKFIDAPHKAYVDAALDYYIDSRLRSSPEEQQHYCKPLVAGT